MTMNSNNPNADHSLPLTDRAVKACSDGLISELMIRNLVDSFYEVVRGDDLLGPVFCRHVEDWSVHLPKMYDFWSTVVLHSGRYAGRPLETHGRIPELTHAHFDRWIELWDEVVARVLPASAQAAFTVPARRMAFSMASQLIGK